MELPGRRQRDRPKRRYMDAVKEDMQVVGVRIEDTENRVKWKTVICCGNPEKGKAVRRRRRRSPFAIKHERGCLFSAFLRSQRYRFFRQRNFAC